MYLLGIKPIKVSIYVLKLRETCQLKVNESSVVIVRGLAVVRGACQVLTVSNVW